MGILVVTALAVGLFALLVIGASRSDNATVQQLERNGRLCLGTVLSYDGDDLAEVEFIPVGAVRPIKAFGIGHFHKKQFPPGSEVAVWYTLCALQLIDWSRNEQVMRGNSLSNGALSDVISNPVLQRTATPPAEREC